MTILAILLVAELALLAFYCHRIARELRRTRLEAAQRGGRNLELQQEQAELQLLLEGEARKVAHGVVAAGEEEHGNEDDTDDDKREGNLVHLPQYPDGDGR